MMGYDGMRYMLNVSKTFPRCLFYGSIVRTATDFDTAGAALYASDMHQFYRSLAYSGLK